MNSIQCRFLLFARQTRVTPQGHLDIMGIFGHATTRQVPVPCPPDDFCVVSFWKGPHNMRTNYTLRITGPQGFAYSVGAHVMFGPDETAYGLGVFEDLELPHFGDYRFEIFAGEEAQASEILPVMPEI